LRRRAISGSLVALVAIAGLAGAARADNIDRVLAVVDTRIITLSDARAALLFGFVVPPPNADPVHVAMQHLVDRELMLTEVQRYLPAEPPRQQIDARLAEIRARFPTAAAFDQAIASTGLRPSQLADLVRDDLRIRAYIDERFAAPQSGDRQARIAEWLSGLRRRADVRELYLPQPR
jgi:hypothetical protein